MFDWNKVIFIEDQVTYSDKMQLQPDVIIYQIIFNKNSSDANSLDLLTDMNCEINKMLQAAEKNNLSDYLAIKSAEIFLQNDYFYLKINTLPGKTAGAIEKLKHYFTLPSVISIGNQPKVKKAKRIIRTKDIGSFVPNKEKKMLMLVCDKDVNEYLKTVNRNRKLGLVLTYNPEQSLLTITPPTSILTIDEWTMDDLNAEATKLKLSPKEYNAQRRLHDWNNWTSPSASKPEKLQQIGSTRKRKYSWLEGVSNKMPRKSAAENQFTVDAGFISGVIAEENSNEKQIAIVLDTPSSILKKSSNLDFSIQYNGADEIENLEIRRFLNSA